MSDALPLTWWSDPARLVTIAEGELWVSKDLLGAHHPLADWIEGRPLYARDYTEADGHGRSRAFRRLDRDWYTWIHQATLRARGRLEQEQPHTWRELAARSNALWAIACRWWGQATVAELHASHQLDARYEPPAAISAAGLQPYHPTAASPPAAGLPADFNTWPFELRMEHATACAQALARHGITTDSRGHYCGRPDQTRDALVRIACRVAREVADAMRGAGQARVAA